MDKVTTIFVANYSYRGLTIRMTTSNYGGFYTSVISHCPEELDRKVSMGISYTQSGAIEDAVQRIDEYYSEQEFYSLYNDMVSGIKTFCERVERGEIRSKTTYEKFRGLIKRTEPRGNGPREHICVQLDAGSTITKGQ